MTSVPSRIVQVSTSDIGGGAERVAADLHRSCLARGLDSTLAVGFRFDDVERTVLIPNDANRGAWARTLLPLAPTPASAMEQMGAGKRFARRLVKTLAEPRRAWRISRGYEDFDFPATGLLPTIGGARADLLHLHNLHGGYFDLRCLPQLSAAVPTVITAHDTWLGSGHCAYTLDCGRWQTGCGQCPYLHTPPAVRRDKTAENLALKQSIYRASKVHLVGPSRWVVGELERSVFSEALIDSHVIPNGVDQAVFRPGSKEDARRRLRLPADALVLVFSVAGEESPYKDFASIRAALPAIVAQTAPREVLLLALGGYPVGAGVPGGKIVSVPYSPDPAHVATHLQAADLALHMAHGENHPLALLEAQSCGVPVVASAVGGIPETLVDGETGVLVPEGSVAELSAAASALLGDDVRRAQMSAAAAEFARGRFGLERMTDDYLRRYEDATRG